MSLIPMGAAGLKSAAGGAAFDPESVGWHSLFWAEGTNFVAQGYSDTDNVTVWPNEMAENDADSYNTVPTYDASNSQLNNQPCVLFGLPNGNISVTSFVSNPSYSSPPLSIVVIGATGQSTSSFVGNGNYISKSSTVWTLSGGGTISGGTADNNAHLFVGQFDGTTGDNGDGLFVDGTQVADGSAGSTQITSLCIGAYSSTLSRVNGPISLVGLWEGDVMAESWWADFESWVSSHYGITIT